MDLLTDLLPEQIADLLVASLTRYLNKYEDVESAISVYKTACSVIRQVEEIKKAAVDLAEHDLQLQQQELIRTDSGSAGWTHPRTAKLNKQAWQEAVARDNLLAQIQAQYEQAEDVLKKAQAPYMELPEPSFYIR